MHSIDLNCDMGEGYDSDPLIMPYISSANIACGFHAGDAETMKRTVELCLEHNVAIGAHPSYPDVENFGRTDMLGKGVELSDIPKIIFEQLEDGHFKIGLIQRFGTTDLLNVFREFISYSQLLL